MTALYMKAKCILLHVRSNYSKEVTLERSTAMQSRKFSVFVSVSTIHRILNSGQAGAVVADQVHQHCRDQDISGALVHQASRNLKHSVFCLTTGPKPPLKRFLHIVLSRASSFK